MARVTVTLNSDEIDYLRKLAKRDIRSTREQARYLLVWALLSEGKAAQSQPREVFCDTTA